MSVTPYWTSSDGRLVIYHGRAEDVLPEIGPFDAVITDPPYGTDVPRDGYGRRQIWHGEQHIEGDADLTAFSTALMCLRPQLRRNAWVASFCSPKRRADMERACDAAILRIFGEIVWDKVRPGLGDGIRYQHESILLGSFGGPSGRCSLFSVLRSLPPTGLHGHPHEKPVDLMAALIRYTTTKNDLIVDPFVGSGSTLAAAMSLGRRAIGIDVDERWCEVAARRLEDPPLLAALNAPEQTDLFAEALP